MVLEHEWDDDERSTKMHLKYDRRPSPDNKPLSQILKEMHQEEWDARCDRSKKTRVNSMPHEQRDANNNSDFEESEDRVDDVQPMDGALECGGEFSPRSDRGSAGEPEEVATIDETQLPHHHNKFWYT